MLSSAVGSAASSLLSSVPSSFAISEKMLGRSAGAEIMRRSGTAAQEACLCPRARNAPPGPGAKPEARHAAATSSVATSIAFVWKGTIVTSGFRAERSCQLTNRGLVGKLMIRTALSASDREIRFEKFQKWLQGQPDPRRTPSLRRGARALAAFTLNERPRRTPRHALVPVLCTSTSLTTLIS